MSIFSSSGTTVKSLPSPLVLLAGAFTLYRERFLQAVSILGYGILGVGGSVFLFGVIFILTSIGTASASLLVARSSFIIGGFFVLLAVLAIALAYLWAILALTVCFLSDQPVTARAAYKTARRYVLPYLWVIVATSLLTLIGLSLLLVPGIIASIWFALGIVVLVAEDRRGLDVLLVSREYARGRWWGMFYRVVVLTLLVTIVSFVADLPSRFGMGQVVGAMSYVVVQLLLFPLISAYTVLLYRSVLVGQSGAVVPDLRLRRVLLVGLIIAAVAGFAILGVVVFA